MVLLKSKYKMAKKVFLNRERAIPTVQAPSVSREEPDLEVASSSRNISKSETIKVQHFLILDEISKTFQNLILLGVV